jgi:hypothetical protein
MEGEDEPLPSNLLYRIDMCVLGCVNKCAVRCKKERSGRVGKENFLGGPIRGGDDDEGPGTELEG